MSIDLTVTFLIPACSWRRVQQCPAFRSEIAEAFVEECDIEFWHRQYHPFCLPKTPCRVNSNFMSIDAIETYLILACSRRRAKRRPGVRSKVGSAVVEESAIESWDRQHPLSSFPGPPPPKSRERFHEN